ncbi:conserved hypothetical protein [Methylobacterium sp. 4-46]|uniref:hypothetical protein n=1 Tax=unclassified Methylobacterium TaxID=2615210 RepID=UPI000165CB1A|nr:MULTISPECIES: hypothetical protein [Methylobacterium]ACA19567.1 conserved hypothetical protein [Methylobacterium sp. 4-46]WFT78762.1 hypothetical protein QA634_26375 [Methylobacterium nodulans]
MPESEPADEMTQEEAFQIPDEVAAALTEFAAVEQLSRGQAICTILADYLRLKGYLKGAPRG